MESKEKRTWAEIDLVALEHNYRALRAMLPAECKFLGVVKANAYGHGALPVARRLEQLGADYLAVASLDEAAELRVAGVTTPILILGHTPVEFASNLVQLRLTQSVWDLETARALSAAAQAEGRALKIHLKVDTGMSRLGFLCDEEHRAKTVETVSDICALPWLEHEGIFTHFADADGSEEFTMQQFTCFLDLLKALEERGLTFSLRHCAASAATLRYPCTHLDMVRPGIALYGHYPSPECEGLDGPGPGAGDDAEDPSGGGERAPCRVLCELWPHGPAGGKDPSGSPAHWLCRWAVPRAVQPGMRLYPRSGAVYRGPDLHGPVHGGSGRGRPSWRCGGGLWPSSSIGAGGGAFGHHFV